MKDHAVVLGNHTKSPLNRFCFAAAIIFFAGSNRYSPSVQNLCGRDRANLQFA